jgi:flagellar biosynthesis/type III secretory pathway M-ring protein FliF/YscJ
MLELLLAVAIVMLVAWFVTAPLRRQRSESPDDPTEAELADLEARKEAKYRQIRDAEADHASGKLSDRDYERLDRELRGEAIAILKRLDRLSPPKQG